LNAKLKFHNTTNTQIHKSTMNPNSISSTFSVQQVSKHHYLIRGDERVKDYMNFCDVKWSNTYQGWIVHEDDEVDLIQMHMEVLDLAKEQKAKSDKKKSAKAKPKPKTTKPVKTTKKKVIISDDESDDDEEEPPQKKKGDIYERFKRGEEISDDDDDEYIPSSEPSSETISDESEEDTDDEDEDEEEEEEEEDDTEESEDDEEELGETDSKRKKEFQFYKKGLLAFGKMTERQQEKLEANWNKSLRGWVLRMSTLEKLKKMGWTEIGHDEQKTKDVVVVKPSVTTVKPSVTTVNVPKVTKKPKEIEEKTFEEYMYALLVKGEVTDKQAEELQGIYHPGLKGFLVGINNRDKLVQMGFRDTKPKETKEKEVVKIQFTQGEQLKVE
jgi:hypothetical protein